MMAWQQDSIAVVWTDMTSLRIADSAQCPWSVFIYYDTDHKTLDLSTTTSFTPASTLGSLHSTTTKLRKAKNFSDDLSIP